MTGRVIAPCAFLSSILKPKTANFLVLHLRLWNCFYYNYFFLSVLGVLPLPDAIQSEVRQTNSLISTPEILQDARRLLNGEQVDNSLIQRLHCYLSKVNTSYL